MSREDFPYKRVPLADSASIVDFVCRWRPVFEAGTGAIEDHHFAEELWELGFIYEFEQPEELLSLMSRNEQKALKAIASENNILLLGDAIFCDWRSMIRSDYCSFVGTKECFTAMLDRLETLAKQL